VKFIQASLTIAEEGIAEVCEVARPAMTNEVGERILLVELTPNEQRLHAVAWIREADLPERLQRPKAAADVTCEYEGLEEVLVGSGTETQFEDPPEIRDCENLEIPATNSMEDA